ncbi:MAG: glycosyltransferase family 2 protein [Clostridia bacterium]|nr:glycosyltransferase family 2 protein [Clostridia bacterium]
MKKLAIVVPCYNEEPVLEDTARQLTDLLSDLIAREKVSPDSFILFVNDGSTDGTWRLIEQAYAGSRLVCGLNLAANVGHQNALLAGLSSVQLLCDVTITIDADLQDDIAVMEEMIDQFEAGADIVYGVRKERKTDTFFKRFTAQSFYKVMALMGVKSVYNHADYRLMSARAVRQLLQYSERNLFLRGIVPLIGYPTAKVYYARKARTAGESKYPLKKMLSFAFEGITSFSIKPITMVMMAGIAILFCTVLAFIYILASYFTGHTVSGWASIMTSIWFLGGMQLVAIGIVGEYVGKTYLEVKRRPRFNIERFLTHEEKTDSDR